MSPSFQSASKQVHVLVAAALATLLTIWVMNAWMSPRGGEDQPVQLRQTSAPAAGTIIVGSFNAWGTGGGYLGDKSQFPAKLTYAIKGGRYSYIVGTAYTTNCPGVGQVVPPGYLCFYQASSTAATFIGAFNPNTGFDSTSKTGFGMYWSASGSGNSFAYGQWTMKVGGPAQAPTRSAPVGRQAGIR